MSGDGGVVVGTSGSAADPTLYRPLRWTADLGSQPLPVPSGLHGVGAQFISADGAVSVGTGYDAAMESRVLRWVDGEVSEIEALHGKFVCGVSRDGAVIVYAGSGELGLFDAQQGMRSLRELLAPTGVELSGWYIATAYGVSADARSLVLSATYEAGDHRPRAVLVQLP
jgi:uncharacterized membrane protein